MNTTKRLAALVAALALSAIGAANASAAQFTSTAATPLNATATATQVFTTNAGTVECTGLSATGNVSAGSFTSLEMTVHYAGCTGFFSTIHISPATFELTHQQVHLTNTVTITVTNVFGECRITVPPQTFGGVSQTNTGTGGINLTPHVSGLTYVEEKVPGQASSFPCGEGTRSNGTYTGDSHLFVAGGVIGIDTP